MDQYFPLQHAKYKNTKYKSRMLHVNVETYCLCILQLIKFNLILIRFCVVNSFSLKQTVYLELICG